MKITVEKAGIEGRLDESIIINGRWQIYKDGCIYDIQSGKDIPLRDCECASDNIQNLRDELLLINTRLGKINSSLSILGK